MKLQVKKSAIRAVAKFASKDDVRYYLNAVCLEVKHDVAILVATDGHRLGAILLPLTGGEDLVAGNYIIPLELVKLVRKVGRKESTYVIVEVVEPSKVDSVVAFTEVDRAGVILNRMESKLIDAKYPEWRRVVPQKLDGKPSQFNGEYVWSYTDAARELGADGVHAHIAHNGDGPALVSIPGHPEFVGVLMPMRPKPAFETAPDWALPEEKAKTKKAA